jgi:YesN/AraC family two-component response regulator
VFKLHLEQEGFKEILTAENGEKGIEILCEGDNMDTVSLILCDIRMPIINGMVAADNFKEMAPNIPVVIVTRYADSEMAAFMKKKGIKDYLVKPVEKQKLVDCVKKVIVAG